MYRDVCGSELKKAISDPLLKGVQSWVLFIFEPQTLRLAVDHGNALHHKSPIFSKMNL